MTVLRYVLVSVAMCCGLISTLGQSQPLQLYPIPVHGKWGYIDRNGSVRIPRRFDSASAFREGLAVVQVDAKYGFIDSNGIAVVQPTFEDAFPFSEGLSGACNGQVAIALHYHMAAPFHEGVVIVIEPELIGKWYGSSVIDRTGRRVYGPVTQAINEYHQGVASTYSLDGSALGFIDRQGKHVLKTRFAGVNTYFSEGLAAVSSPDASLGARSKGRAVLLDWVTQERSSGLNP